MEIADIFNVGDFLFMFTQKDLKKACQNMEKQLKAIEKEYKRKNIYHRLIEDQVYNFYRGKLFAFKWFMKELYG